MNVSVRHSVPLALAVLAAGAWRAWRFVDSVKRAHAMAQPDAVLHAARAPQASCRLLILGDSTAVGIGATGPSETVAGRLAREFPSISIENHARMGARARDLAGQLQMAEFASYDAVLIAIGGNDILRGSSEPEFRAGLKAGLDAARALSEAVIVVNSGNVGAAPLFPWPLNAVLSRRSLRFRSAFEAVCSTAGAEFVNFTYEPSKCPFRRERARYFAADGLHPSGAVYSLCVERLKTDTRLALVLAAASAECLQAEADRSAAGGTVQPQISLVHRGHEGTDAQVEQGGLGPVAGAGLGTERQKMALGVLLQDQLDG
jgi:lysophospholipase L1-like esterase